MGGIVDKQGAPKFRFKSRILVWVPAEGNNGHFRCQRLARFKVSNLNNSEYNRYDTPR